MRKDSEAALASAAAAGEKVDELDGNVRHVRNVLGAMEEEYAADSRALSEWLDNLRDCEEDIMALLRLPQEMSSFEKVGTGRKVQKTILFMLE